MDAEMDPSPFPLPEYRFDQRNEVFKRRTWDEEFVPHGKRLYTQVKSSRAVFGLDTKAHIP